VSGVIAAAVIVVMVIAAAGFGVLHAVRIAQLIARLEQRRGYLDT
jgi:hypothetical protein